MSIFYLQSDEDYDSRTEKLTILYVMYGDDNEFLVKDEWNGFKIKISYKRRPYCSKENLMEESEGA